MNLVKSGDALSEANINAFEKELGARLPKDYKSFIASNNGGVPEVDALYDFYDEVLGEENTSVVRKFYPLQVKSAGIEEDSVARVAETMKRERAIPEDMLPVADDPYGNPICISLGERDYGAVYHLNHEFEDIDTGFLTKSKIANSFAIFVDSLRESKE